MFTWDEMYEIGGAHSCLMCGCKTIYVDKIFPDGYSCFCPKCDFIQDKRYNSLEEAIKAWNRGEIKI